MTDQTEQQHPERECVSCGAKGHWYLHCPSHSFFAMAAQAFGLPSLIQSQPIASEEKQSEPPSSESSEESK